MATRGRPIPVMTLNQIKRLTPQIGIKPTAREARVDRNTVRKYTRPAK